MENILNNKFINLDEVSTKYHQQYLNNKPFPHIVFDNFFSTLFLEKIPFDSSLVSITPAKYPLLLLLLELDNSRMQVQPNGTLVVATVSSFKAPSFTE